MSFSFGFGGDDIDEDDLGDEDRGPETDHSTHAREHLNEALMEPRILSLDELLSSLPSSLHYRLHNIPPEYGNLKDPYDVYPRRDLHDIRAQIMAEEDPSNVGQVLEAGLASSGDISSGVYEGGFKTWECSNDLAWYTREWLSQQPNDLQARLDFVELGAGTAFPSCMVLSRMLKKARSNEPPSRRTMVLADYNEAVLRLATFPNIFLSWFEAGQPGSNGGYLDVTDELKTSFKEDLAHRGIDLAFVSGAWGQSFDKLVLQCLHGGDAGAHRQNGLLILASETVYAPVTLHPFTNTVLALLRARATGRRAGQDTHSISAAVVAAKKIYFGVGGGVDEFKRVLGEAGGAIVDRWEGGLGVGRWIGEVRGH